jgi:hypothetical protein
VSSKETIFLPKMSKNLKISFAAIIIIIIIIIWKQYQESIQ